MNIPCPMNCELIRRSGSKQENVSFDTTPDRQTRQDLVDGVNGEIVTASDIVPRGEPRRRVFAAIIVPQTLVDEVGRDRCMNCASTFESNMFGMFGSGRHHCRFCMRLICSNCAPAETTISIFPAFIQNMYPGRTQLRVCNVCEPILRNDYPPNQTQSTS